MRMYILLFFLSLLASFTVKAQKLKTYKGQCGLYFYSMDDLRKSKSKEIAFYNFQKGETVAFLGAQCAYWEAAYAATTEDVLFYLEDIDTTYFKEQQVQFAWNHYSGIRSKPMTSQYKLVLGTEESTNLPDSLLDKIIIINSFHEFTKQKEMLADISRKLKPGGTLYIDEVVAKESGALHGVCNKRVYLEQEMISLLSQNGYEYTRGVDLKFRKGKPYVKLYSFKIAAK